MAEQPLRSAGAPSDASDRQIAGEARQEADRQYRQLFEGALEGIFRASPDGRILTANSALAEILGYSSSEEVLATVEDFGFQAWAHPDEQIGFAQLLEAEGAVRGFECQCKRKDGTLLWISLSARKVSGLDGNPLCYEGFIEDISKRKRIEESFWRSEERFSKIFLSNPIALSINGGLRSESRYIDVNHAFEQTTGYTREEALGRTPDELGLWADGGEREEAFRELAAQGRLRDFRLRFRRKNGEIGVGSMSIELLQIGDERAAVVAVIDITEHERAKELVEENERKYRALFESAGDGILLTRDGRFVECNSRALQLFRCGREALIGSTPVRWSPLRQPDGRPSEEAVQEKIGKALAGERQVFEWAHVASDGAPFTAEVTLSEIGLSTGQHLLAIVRDITPRKRVEEALVHSEQRYRTFIANSSEGIVCVEFLPPVPIDLPEDEIIDRAHRCGFYTEANDAAARQRGYARASDLVGQPIRHTRDPNDPVNAEWDRRLVRSGFRLPEFEGRFRGPQGNTLFVRNSGFGVVEDGHVHRLWAVSRDVTAEKEANAALIDSEQRFRQLAENIREVFWLEDCREHKLVYMSPAYELIWGRPRENLVNNREEWIESVHWADRPKAAARRDLEATGWDMEYRIIRPDGEVRWIHSLGFPVRNEEGEVYRVAGIAEDVTERKSRERELEILKTQLERENVQLRGAIEGEHVHEEIVGESPAIRSVLADIGSVAPTGATVLILGETGVGKELVARAVHRLSLLADRPLITVNCAALASSLIESELFGHEKGAFTGAWVRRQGRFELADKGTIFLDEIGDLPLDLQAKLLRVLQEGEFQRVGSAITLHANVRVIAATNRDLEEQVRAGGFRPDLYYRLSAFPLTVPPLRDRRGDIPLLVEHFLERFSRTLGKQLTSVSDESLEWMARRPWPGNVRELFHTVERAAIRARGPVVSIENPDRVDGLPEAESLPGHLAHVERDHIVRVLAETNWVIEGPNGAAKRLHLHPNTLRYRLQKLNIRRPK